MQTTLNRGARRRSLASVVLAAAMTAGLAGCGGSDETATGGTPAVTPPPAAPAAALTIKDPWVKAADTGMTAAFGVLVNDTAADVTVVSVRSTASPMEMHEMTMKDGKMVMQPKQGGFVIKAKSTHELAPGGDHLMLMKPAAPVRPGDELSFVLGLADGTSVPFTAIAKPFAGAGESYDPGMSMPGTPMSGMASATP